MPIIPILTNQVTALLQSAVSRVRVSSAVNPCVWLCVTMTPFALIIALVARDPTLKIACLVLGFIPPLLFAIAYFYFALKNPDKLRSEDYELRKQMLTMIQEKGGDIPVSPTSLNMIANPSSRRVLPSRGGPTNG